MTNQQTNIPPENIPVVSIQEKRGRPTWFWVLVAAVMFGGGLAVLILIGDVFIREVTQEVVVEERANEPDAVLPEVGPPGEDRPPRGVESRLAPYFELDNLKGEKVKISDFLGSPVVVTFWTTWNVLSVDQLRILDNYKGHPCYKDDPCKNDLFQIIAINSQEDKSIVSNFIERGGYDVEVLLDENGTVGEMYGIQTLPVTYFLDKEGNIAEVYVGLLDAEEIVDKAGRILNEE